MYYEHCIKCNCQTPRAAGDGKCEYCAIDKYTITIRNGNDGNILVPGDIVACEEALITTKD